MLEIFDTLDLNFAVLRHGVQQNYLLHKACAFLAMDSAWLLNPEGHSQARTFLASLKATAEPFALHENGFVLVNFDAKTITSHQAYKDITLLHLSEIASHGGSSPVWMDWAALVDDAFANQCISRVSYESRKGGSITEELPLEARGHKNSAMRFASRGMPAGYQTKGLIFKPDGWTVRHCPGSRRQAANGNIVNQLFVNLQRLKAG